MKKKSVLDVAKYILEKTETKKIERWKIHKLCFYCQAWSFAWTGKELFPEEFEAWSNGPVSPDLYEAQNNSNESKFVTSLDTFPFGDSSVFSKDEKETIDIVYNDYMYMEPYDLVALVQSEKPWAKSRGELPYSERNIHPKIDKGLIKRFYTRLYKRYGKKYGKHS